MTRWRVYYLGCMILAVFKFALCIDRLWIAKVLFSYQINLSGNVTRAVGYDYTIKNNYIYAHTRQTLPFKTKTSPPPYPLPPNNVSTYVPSRSFHPLNVDTRQNPRRHVVFIKIQPNAYHKYLYQTAGVILTLFGWFVSVDLEFMNIEDVFLRG
jgi:hypothetical protein